MRINNPVRIIFAIVSSFLLTLSSIGVITTIYKVNIDYWMFSVVVLVFVSLFTVLNVNKRSWVGYAGLSVVLIFLGICTIRDFFAFKTCLTEVFNFAVAMFDSRSSFTEFKVNPAQLATMFAFVSSLAIFFTIRMTIYKKSLVGPMVWYLAVFGASMLVSTSRVNPNWIMLFVFSFLMLIIYECLRKTNGTVLETTIVYAFVPVFLICLFFRFAFPFGQYNMQGVADEHYNFVLTTIDETLGTNLKRYFDRTIKAYDPLDELVKSTQVQVNKSDMRTVGDQSDKKVEMMLVQLAMKDGIEFSDYSRIYLKASAKSIYNGSVWFCSNEERTDIELSLDEVQNSDYLTSGHSDDVFLTVNTLGNIGYTFLYTPNKIGSVMYEGDLTDFSSGSYYFDPTMIENNEYTSNNSSRIPYKFTLIGPDEDNVMPEYSDEYLDYVYSDMLLDTTGCAYYWIVDSMPDWFQKVHDGEIVLTDAEKVVAVMDYLYHTKSYDLNMDYVPEDMDFVEWFINDCNSGYCVHFASSAAVLLKMLDVPTRYVSGYSISEPATMYERDITKSQSEIVHYNVYEYIVMDSDAHAWCEFFDPEYGWIGFDPTNNTFVPNAHGFVPPVNPFSTEYDEEVIHMENITYATLIEREKIEKEEQLQTIQEEAERDIDFAFWCLEIALLSAVTFLIVRLVDIIIWRRKFIKGSNNDRGRAMCRYCLVLQSHNEITISDEIMKLTDYAMYRREGLTDEELDSMRELCKEYSSRVFRNNKWWKVIQLRVVYQEIL